MKTTETQILVQCDFDGTITEEDEAFLLLDAFASGDWRQALKEYQEDKITVGDFNSRVFAMISADRQRLVDMVTHRARVRPGFKELVARCRDNGFRLVIVSNGLDFYIEAILEKIGVSGVEVFAATTRFGNNGLDVRYIGPDGAQLQDGFKEAYTRSFLGDGYRVIYVGNGPSDMPAALMAHRVFATGELFDMCREKSLDCASFADLHDVAKGLGV